MRPFQNGTIRRYGAGVSYGTGANVKQLSAWDYATTDDKAAIETAGHFNALAGEMSIGDTIKIRADLDGTPALYEYIVSANTGSAVTVALSTATAAA
ncbi:hypothetical protein NA8A_04828 [Nitratireductor indicus C115]|uniref:Uncharacterized protein n=1 Tax=Nitratireductor indicus C115 TaxID=1231190 RepID=K2PQJ6_9HYPH|nr:hypothetical protein [Nitratireductor indicus]EKF43327.1 hypothetical protein NA8A_04828 [Nitratireductor indicus C115]SFQ09947.1 hypothetical protein SAMN05216176_101339 [Nitratireductor indicus]